MINYIGYFRRIKVLFSGNFISFSKYGGLSCNLFIKLLRVTLSYGLCIVVAMQTWNLFWCVCGLCPIWQDPIFGVSLHPRPHWFKNCCALILFFNFFFLIYPNIFGFMILWRKVVHILWCTDTSMTRPDDTNTTQF